MCVCGGYVSLSLSILVVTQLVEMDPPLLCDTELRPVQGSCLHGEKRSTVAREDGRFGSCQPAASRRLSSTGLKWLDERLCCVNGGREDFVPPTGLLCTLHPSPS
ncbi:hypothetical protein F5X99DRAFT_397406 [Biscogniauxia marginata]|nr:hypothetical protein F5X99DRAFT_397406 [Biscogniauxia marginata]